MACVKPALHHDKQHYACSENTLLYYLTLYRMVMPIGTPFLKEKINN